MKEFKFWLPVVNSTGVKESIPFVFNATSWTQARKMMSDAIKAVRAA
jgi:hypothetical protein